MITLFITLLELPTKLQNDYLYITENVVEVGIDLFLRRFHCASLLDVLYSNCLLRHSTGAEDCVGGAHEGSVLRIFYSGGFYCLDEKVTKNVLPVHHI